MTRSLLACVAQNEQKGVSYSMMREHSCDKVDVFPQFAPASPRGIVIEASRLRWKAGIPMMRERTRIRIARAVALELEGLKGPEIARRLDMKPKGLESLRARPQHTAQLVEVGNELIRRMDEALYEKFTRLMSGRIREE